jgi:LysM repeat protein
MEVLVSRKSRKRASRALIGVLLGTIAIGSVFYFRNSKKADASEAQATANSTASSVSPSAKPPADVAVIAAKKAEAAKPAAPAPFVTATPTGPAGHVPVVPTVNGVPTPLIPASATPAAARATPDTAATPQPSAQLALNTSSPKPAQAQPTVYSGAVPTLAQAKAKQDAGQLLASRNDYNAALVSGTLSPSDTKIAKGALMEINKTIVFSPRRFADDVWAGSYVVKPGDHLQKIAGKHDVTWEFLCRINGMSDPRKLRAGQTLKLIKGPFHATVSKSAFMMDVYLGAPGGPGSLYVTSFPVGLGTDDSTPTGTWEIKPQSKLRNPTYYNPKEEGDRIVAADDPKNPLGEFWMGLVGTDGHAVGKESYGIHGTIEPDSIGKMASLGCIRLLNEDVGQVFDMMVEVKSTVLVKE